MAKELSPEEETNLKSLNDNMQQRLSEYRQDWRQKPTEEQKKELKKLDEYLQGCYNSEIDDTEINIRFTEAKSEILKKLIDTNSNS